MTTSLAALQQSEPYIAAQLGSNFLTLALQLIKALWPQSE
jgi:hypothetical protein